LVEDIALVGWEKVNGDMSKDVRALHLPPTKEFDYSTVPADLAADLRKQAERIRKQNKTATAAIIEIGNDLRAVKQRLERPMAGLGRG
jgi:hypothetical protein